MKREQQFFSAITVSDQFWEAVKDESTRVEAAQKGYLGQTFGLEDFDYKILPKIGPVETKAEFAQKYSSLKAEVNKK